MAQQYRQPLRRPKDGERGARPRPLQQGAELVQTLGRHLSEPLKPPV